MGLVNFDGAPQYQSLTAYVDDQYTPHDFDELSFNLHTRTKRARNVAIFIHGFGGGGYTTWADYPKYVFTGGRYEPLDVAVFNYHSGAWAIFTRRSKLDLDAQRLVAGVRELAQYYSSIYFISHSLGGIIAEDAIVKYLNFSSHVGDKDNAKIAGLFVFASPRAGTGYANPLIVWLIREFRWLRRFSQKTVEIETFFTNHVQSRALASTIGLQYLIPRFACLGSNDRIVSAFSAGFGIPDLQKKFLPGDHRSISKPKAEDSPQVVWLFAKIKAIEELRSQWFRESQHAQVEAPQQPLDDREIVTELWHGTLGSEWTRVYIDLLRAAAADGVPVRDASSADADEARIDLLVSIHDADQVIGNGLSEHPRVAAARMRRREGGRTTVGIATVGTKSAEATAIVNEWVGPDRPAKLFYIESALNRQVLQEIAWQWLQSVIGRRNPLSVRAQSRTLADRLVDLETPIDDYGASGYL